MDANSTLKAPISDCGVWLSPHPLDARLYKLDVSRIYQRDRRSILCCGPPRSRVIVFFACHESKRRMQLGTQSHHELLKRSKTLCIKGQQCAATTVIDCRVLLNEDYGHSLRRLTCESFIQFHR
jgi:hypothetical protein